MNFRTVTLWMCIGVLAAFGLYTVKYKVQEIKSEVVTAETQLREEKKNLHVLTAEWTYLNRPERLRQLSAKYLDIKPVHGAQLADFSTLPVGGVAMAKATSNGQDHAASEKTITLASGANHAR